MNYNQKLLIANAYLFGIAGISWDDLGDINSLHDCETSQDIQEACNERLVDADFPSDILEHYDDHVKFVDVNLN